MTGLVAVLVGAALCFAGVASIHLAVLLSGFGVCWMLADLLGASTSAALLIGLVGAVVGWIIVSLVFRAALFFVGAVVGAVIGAKLYSALDTDRNVAIALIFTVGFAFLSGWLANRWRVRMLLFLDRNRRRRHRVERPRPRGALAGLDAPAHLGRRTGARHRAVGRPGRARLGDPAAGLGPSTRTRSRPQVNFGKRKTSIAWLPPPVMC